MTGPTSTRGASRDEQLAEATRRRAQVLKLIKQSINERGYPPNVRELQESTGVGSTLTIRRDLTVLAQEGRIERDPGVERGIRLV
jgi:repressor LexA